MRDDATRRRSIEAYLRRAPWLHAYELGDLDSREAPHVEWLVDDDAAPRAVALVYRGLATPTLVALAHDGDDDDARDREARVVALVRAHADAGALPARMYAHLSPRVERALAARYRGESLGDHLKLGLPRARFGELAREPAVTALTTGDADEATAFYAAHYADGYFEPAALARGPYLALRDHRGIVAAAGTHVYSPELGVAALGNITTRSDARGLGYARRITSELCARIAATGLEVIGLNVRADNPSAIRCYERIGFVHVAPFVQWRFERR